MGGNNTHKALSQSVVKIYCFSSLEFICRKTAKVKPRSRDSRITHTHTLTHPFWVPSLICCCAMAICYGWSKHYSHQSGTCTEVLSSICPRPVICRETVMESWQIVCLLERVGFFFHAHPFLSFSPPYLPCITLSFSLPPSTGSLPASSFFQGMRAMDGRPSTQKLWKHSTRALVISNPSTAPCSITTTSSFLIVSLSPIQLDLSLSLPPPLPLSPCHCVAAKVV